MFPKVLGSSRIAVGTPASLPTAVYEGWQGGIFVINSATFTNADAADEYEWQYSDNGGTDWIDTTFSEINTSGAGIPYTNTTAVRWRHVNDYFAYIGAWSSQINDAVYDSGGETAARTAWAAASPAPTISAQFNSSTGIFTLTITNRPSLATQTYWDSELYVSIPYLSFSTYEEVIRQVALNSTSVTVDFNSLPYPNTWAYPITATWRIGYPNQGGTLNDMLTKQDLSVTVI